jgi:hypothetical protein
MSVPMLNANQSTLVRGVHVTLHNHERMDGMIRHIVIQGSASDITKLAMLRIQKAIMKNAGT